jgi:hypothetical protein
MSDHKGEPDDVEHRQLIQPQPRDRSAHFLYEEDARRAADALEAMFKKYRSNTTRPGTDSSRLLTIMLPENPSLATFFVDPYVAWKAKEIVERHDGTIWPAVVDASVATTRRVTTRDLMKPRGASDSRQQPTGDAPGEDAPGTEPLDASER